MKMEQIQHGTVTVLVPDGALIEEEADDFSRRVRERLQSGSVRVVLQLNHVPFIDSAGL